MTWQEYRDKKKIRVELESIGLPGFYLIIKDPGAYTLPELEALGELSPQSGPKEFRRALPHVILDWNLTHPDTDKLLPLPSKDVKSLDVLPMDIFNEIGRAITKALGVEGAVPEKKGT